MTKKNKRANKNLYKKRIKIKRNKKNNRRMLKTNKNNQVIKRSIKMMQLKK